MFSKLTGLLRRRPPQGPENTGAGKPARVTARAEFDGISIVAFEGAGLHYLLPGAKDGYKPIPDGGQLDLGDGRRLTIKQVGSSGLSISCSSRNGGGVRVQNANVNGDLIVGSSNEED